MVGFLLDILAGKFILTADERGLTRIKTNLKPAIRGRQVPKTKTMCFLAWF
jgi:hypothetical protein